MTSWVDPDEQTLADHLLQGVPGLRERCAAEARSTTSTWPGPAAPLRATADGEPSPDTGALSAAGEPPGTADGIDGVEEGAWPLGLVLEALATLLASTGAAERPGLFRLVAPLLEHAAGAPETEDALRYGLLDRLSHPDRALLAEVAEPALWESLRALTADLEAGAGPLREPGRP